MSNVKTLLSRKLTKYRRPQLLCGLVIVGLGACSPVPTKVGARPQWPDGTSASGSREVRRSLPPIPTGRREGNLLLVGGTRGFWAELPAITYAVDQYHLVQMNFIDEKGFVVRRDFRDKSGVWRRGLLIHGVPSNMAVGTPPERVWLNQFEARVAVRLLVVDDSVAIPVPPLQQVMATPKSSPTPLGQVSHLIQFAFDHVFETHLSNGAPYAGCRHQEILSIGAAILARSAF